MMHQYSIFPHSFVDFQLFQINVSHVATYKPCKKRRNKMNDSCYQWYKTNNTTFAITELSEYHGEEEITLLCTQLFKEKYHKKDRTRILNEWIVFLNNNPNALKKIDIVGRMTQPLFDAVCSQKNMVELIIKWGRYPDLMKLRNLKKLKYLSLCGGPSTKDISPIGELHQLEVLILENITGTTDYSTLEALHNLRQLGIHSSMDGIVKVDNLNFLYNMPNLRNFRTTGFRLLNHDYTPVLQLNKLEYLAVNMPAADHKVWNTILRQKFANIPYNAHRPCARFFS